MTGEPSREVSIFVKAIEIENTDDISAFLDEACADDAQLRADVEALLAVHRRDNSFLERAAPGLDKTMDVSRDALEAGLSQAFGADVAVVIGDNGHSVLKSLGRKLPHVPRVVLREAGEDGSVEKPSSREVPSRSTEDRYQLHGEIARGGMGAIIKGRDADLGRDLAIKVLLDSHKDKPEVIERFVEEAQIGGQLQHPGIVPVYELGQFSDERPFFSMKLVKGKTLATLLAEREHPTVNQAQLLGIFEQVCQTMAYAHSRGVIHRDLKPANIMVGAFGEVQVMDWGLAKVLGEGGVADEKRSLDKHKDVSIVRTRRSTGSDTPEVVGSQTHMGSVMGTPAYMPPEQALGEVDRLDERSDVFGLGAILCEILTGKPPYVGEDGTQVFRQASRGKLDDCYSRVDASGADPQLLGLTKQLLAVEPENRPRNAGVVADGISSHLAGVQQRLKQAELAGAEAQARAEHATRRRKLHITIAGLMLLIAVGAAFSAVRFRQQREAQARLARENGNLAEQKSRLAQLNDQKRAEAERAKETIRIEKLNVEEQKDRAIALSETLKREQYISDMHLVRQAYDDAKIERVHELLEKHIPVVGDTDRRNFEWYYWWRTSHLELDSVDGADFASLIVSPDRKTMAVHAWRGRVELRDTRTLQMLADVDVGIEYGTQMAFSSDGATLATVDTSRVRLWDSSPPSWSITKKLTEDHSIQLSRNVSSIAFSTTESRFAVADEEGQITFWNPQTGDSIAGSLECKDPVVGIEFSADGNLLAALTSSSPEGFSVSIFDLASGSVKMTLRDRRHSATCLAWSRGADRNLIATGSDEGYVSLWSGDSFETQDTLVANDGIRQLIFSPDGSLLAATLSRSAQIWETDSLQPTTTIRGHDVLLNGFGFVDGRELVVTSGASGVLNKWDLRQARPFLKEDSPSDDRLRWLFGRHQPVRNSDVDVLYGVRGFTEAPAGDLTGLSANGKYLAVLKTFDDRTNRIEVFETSESGPRLVYERNGIRAMPEPPTDLVVAGDGSRVVWVLQGHYPSPRYPTGVQGWLAMVDTKADRSWAKPMPHNRCAALSSDGNRLAVMDGHRTRTWILDISDGTVPKHYFEQEREWWLLHDLAFQLETGLAFECVFSPDDSLLAISTSHTDIILLDARSGTKMRTFVGHSGTVWSLAFSNDGALLASGGEDGTVRVWDVETGDTRTTLVGHGSGVMGVAFTGGAGSRQEIRSWDMGGNVFVWPSATKTEVEGTVDYWSARGRLHDERHEFTHAESDWQRAVELQPTDGQQIWLDRARRFALQSQWQPCADSFARYQGKSSPVFEIACAHLIVGDVTSYRQLLARMVERAGEQPGPRAAHNLARTANLLPQDDELTQRAVEWARHGLSTDSWRVSTLGVAQFRAGDYATAIQTLSASASTSWGGKPQSQVVLAMLFIANDDLKSARQFLTVAREFERQKQIRGTQNVGGWLAFNALLRDAESQLEGQARETSPSDLAEAEAAWSRFLESHVPDLELYVPDPERFGTLITSGEWAAAAEVGWRIVESRPNHSLQWLRLAPTLVLSGDEDGYQGLCDRMARQFVGTAEVGAAEQTCKACLLIPHKIDVNELPHELFAAALDEGTASAGFAPWGWSTRALVAYRSGDAESAVTYVQKSEDLEPVEFTHALNLVIRALAYTKLGQSDKASNDITAASEIIDRVIQGNHHDALIPRILLNEAKSMLDGA